MPATLLALDERSRLMSPYPTVATGHDDEVGRVEPRQPLGGTEVGHGGGEERGKGADEGPDEPVGAANDPARDGSWGDVLEPAVDRHVERADERGRRDLRRVEHLDGRMRRLQVRRDVLVEHRRDDRNPAVERDEDHQHLDVVLVLVVHEVDRVHGGEVMSRQDGRDALVGRRFRGARAEGLVTEMHNGFAGGRGQLRDPVREVPRPDDQEPRGRHAR
jgi:hypothetical protein